VSRERYSPRSFRRACPECIRDKRAPLETSARCWLPDRNNGEGWLWECWRCGATWSSHDFYGNRYRTVKESR